MTDALDTDELVARHSLIGTTLGDRYEVIRLLSSGGSGDVYEVKHRELQKIFAAKVLRLGPSTTPDLLKRFQREAQLLCRLKDENVVSVHAFGIDAKSGPYLIMDYIEGEPLSSYISAHKLTIDQSLLYFEQICAGLAAAHEAGVVHRDIKPNNVMLVHNGESNRAILIDFGAGKLMQQDGQKLTQTNALFGTPLYMSPEQCSCGQVDERSDIYSFGCLMYEGLTGRPPFSGDTALEILTKQIGETAQAPSMVNQNVPRYMDAIIAYAMAKRREDRYQSASHLLEDLQKRTCSITPKDTKSLVQAAVTKRRPKAKLYVVSLASIVLLGLITAAAYYVATKLAPLSISQCESLRDQAWSKGDFQEAAAYGLQVTNHFDLLQQKRPPIPAEADEVADQYYKMALIENALGHPAVAKNMAERALFFAASDSRRIPYKLFYADNLVAVGDLSSAERLYRDILADQATELVDQCTTHVHLGQLLMSRGAPADAEKQFKELTLYHSVDHELTAIAMDCAARIYSDQGKLDRAAHWFTEAMSRYVTLGNKVPPVTRSYYSLNEARRSNFARADEQMAIALKLQQELIQRAGCPGDKIAAERDLGLIKDIQRKIKAMHS